MTNDFSLHSTAAGSVNIIYKTFYYDLSQFINGDYSPINPYISNFTDMISLYLTPDRTDIPTSTIAWSDKIIENPLDISTKTALELITISLPNNQLAFFGGSYTSENGYYKLGNPARYVLKENGGIKTLFSKLIISVVENSPTLRKVILYKPM
tara:strand:+ start:22 stop:480 length:459 start_codon:yes stop_codon:yes gene_type:complete